MEHVAAVMVTDSYGEILCVSVRSITVEVGLELAPPHSSAACIAIAMQCKYLHSPILPRWRHLTNAL